MEYVKRLSLAVVMAAALMSFVGVGTASATVLTSGAGVALKVGDKFTLSIESGRSTFLRDTAGNELDRCGGGSLMSGTITNAGGEGITVAGNVGALSWAACTFSTITLKSFGLSVNGTGAGNVSATGTFEVTINTVLFGSCIYGVTGGTSIGTLSAGTFTANAVAEKFSGSAFACPATSKWTGTYTATTPTGLKVDA